MNTVKTLGCPLPPEALSPSVYRWRDMSTTSVQIGRVVNRPRDAPVGRKACAGVENRPKERLTVESQRTWGAFAGGCAPHGYGFTAGKYRFLILSGSEIRIACQGTPGR